MWVTETGWPVSGKQQNQAVASAANARTYWKDVSCSLIKDNVNLYYFTLQDAQFGTPVPSFGIKPAGDLMQVKPLFDLTCPASKVSSYYLSILLPILSPLFLLLLYNWSIISSLLSLVLPKRSCHPCDCMLSASPPVYSPIWAERPSDWYARANGRAKDLEPPDTNLSSSTAIATSFSSTSNKT